MGLTAAAILVPVSAIAAWNPEAAKLPLGSHLFKLSAVVLGLVLAGAGLRRWPPGVSLWEPPSTSVPTSRRETTLVLVILAAAAVARAIGVGSDLWLDEVYSLVGFIRLPVSRILTEFWTDNEHVLYTLLAHAARAVFGEGAAVVRLPALLFGLGSLWAVWRLGRLLAGPREGLLAMCVLAFSYHHVWFSQNARGYTGLLLASVVATELLLRGLWRGRPATWLAYAVVVALGMWVHLTMIFVAAAHGFVLLVALARARAVQQGRWFGLAAVALAGLFTFQFYALVVPQMADVFLRPGAGARALGPEFRTVGWLWGESIRGLGLGTLGATGVMAGAVLLGAGVVSLGRRDRWSTALLLLPAALGGLSLILLGRNLWPRFFFNSSGFAALLGVVGAMTIAEALARRLRMTPSAAAAVCAAALVGVSVLTMSRVYRYPKQDFTGARDFVRQLARPGDRIVGLGPAGHAYRDYYAPEWQTPRSVQELRSVSAHGGTTYVLYTFPWSIRSTDPGLWQVLQKDFELVRVFPGTLGDGGIYVLRQTSGPRAAESEPE